jgi:hypothetical protein
MTTTLLRIHRLRLVSGGNQGGGIQGRSNAAFSLVEFLLAAILITIVVSGTTVTLLVSNRSGRPTGNVDELEQLIAQDLAMIRDLNERFTCCGRECTEAALASEADSSCAKTTGSSTPLTVPNSLLGDSPSASGNLPAACLNGAVAETMIAAFPKPPVAPPGVSLTRTGPTVADPAANRLEWTYTVSVDGVTMISRVVNLVPNAAAFCR